MCDVGDGPEVWNETWRQARKEHRCCSCRETIRPRDRYHYSSGIWDGRANSFKHCARCWQVLNLIQDRADEPVDLLLDCGELWNDNFNDPQPEELAFMTPDEMQQVTP